MRPWFGVNPPPRDWDYWDGWGYKQPPGPCPWEYKTVTTTTTNPQPTVDEEQVRKIVREEVADLIPVDVPDAPPEDLA